MFLIDLLSLTDHFSDGTRLSSLWSFEEIRAYVSGTPATISDIAEQLAWLGSALRCSPNAHELMYCLPSIRVVRSNSSLVPIYHMSFSMERVGSPDRTVSGQCWHDLFDNPVIVKGYPIARKSKPGTGIEIPLNIMAALVGSRRIDTFGGTNIIKGYSKLLVPICQDDNILYWHLESKSDGTRIPFGHKTASHTGYIDNVKMESCRHILGWSLSAEFYAGENNLQCWNRTSTDNAYGYAGSSLASYDVKSSFLNSPDSNSPLAGLYVAASYITGGPAFVICRKDNNLSPTVGRSGETTKLKWIAKEMVLLWDTHEKRGWLINGLSVLLHLVRASLESDRKDRFNTKCLFKPEHLQEPNGLAADAAIDVMLNDENLALKIYNEENGTFKDRVDIFYNIMEKLIDYQKLVVGDEGADMLNRSRRHLEGWDFHDIFTKRDDRIFSRMVALDPEGKSWMDLLRSLSAVTLFGRGFGQLIKPSDPTVCRNWKELPSGRSYIAVSMSDMEPIINVDRISSHTRLGRRVLWHTETNLFEPCTCADMASNNCIEPVQSILPCSLSNMIAPKRKDITVGMSGAVIFGQHSKSFVVWDDLGPPTPAIGSPNATPNTLKVATFSDSGIGSSAGSGVGKSVAEESTSITEAHTGSLDDLDHLFTPGQISDSDSYKIGIICALSLELKTVWALMDQTFLGPRSAPGDENSYVFGRLGQHLVVSACLPFGKYGTNAAAARAKDMRRSFGQISFCFLVGVGGGIPSALNDIRLGDVVVGLENNRTPAVIEYDRGKDDQDKGLERTGFLANPPTRLLNGISRLRSNYQLPPNPLQKYVDEIITRVAKHDPVSAEKYQYPGLNLDALIESTPRGSSSVVKRAVRESNHPVIHYGPIASGNKVIKNSAFRDELARKEGVLCFEMEAAGIVNILPTLVVRGVCDYSDRQKDKLWQDHAAANAAAYVKLLLTNMSTQSSGETSGFTGKRERSQDSLSHKRLRTA